MHPNHDGEVAIVTQNLNGIGGQASSCLRVCETKLSVHPLERNPTLGLKRSQSLCALMADVVELVRFDDNTVLGGIL